MKLVAKCTGCKAEIKVSAFMPGNRIDLAKKKGSEFELRCEKCGQSNQLHIDDVKAVNDFTVPVIGGISVILAIFLTIWFWDWGFISTASFVIPVLLTVTTRQNQRSKINQFNRLYYNSKRLINKRKTESK